MELTDVIQTCDSDHLDPLDLVLLIEHATVTMRPLQEQKHVSTRSVNARPYEAKIGLDVIPGSNFCFRFCETEEMPDASSHLPDGGLDVHTVIPASLGIAV